jgi:integrase
VAIIKRGDRYGVRVWEPACRRHRWLGTFPNLREAKRVEADATLRPRTGASLTVEQWSRAWLANYARPAAASRQTYKYAVRRIVKDVGELQLRAVDRPGAKALSRAWPYTVTRTAATMWADALRDGLCDVNPFTRLGLRRSRGRRDIAALTEPEIRRLTELAREQHGDYGDEAAALILFAAYTGVRPGELAALQWDDLNPVDREATISRTLDGQGGVKVPKNGLERIIVLPPLALQALSMVARRTDSPYVFHTSRGRRLVKGSLHYLWRPVTAAWRAETGRDLDLHELRHACATLLLERGLSSADVALQLGHTDGGRLVQTLYGHPDERLARDRVKMSFAADHGHKRGRPVRDVGRNPATSA